MNIESKISALSIKQLITIAVILALVVVLYLNWAAIKAELNF